MEERNEYYYIAENAACGHTFVHLPQPMHFDESNVILFLNNPSLTSVTASVGHIRATGQNGDLSQSASLNFTFFIETSN